MAVSLLPEALDARAGLALALPLCHEAGLQSVARGRKIPCLFKDWELIKVYTSILRFLKDIYIIDIREEGRGRER